MEKSELIQLRINLSQVMIDLLEKVALPAANVGAMDITDPIHDAYQDLAKVRRVISAKIGDDQ